VPHGFDAGSLAERPPTGACGCRKIGTVALGVAVVDPDASGECQNWYVHTITMYFSTGISPLLMLDTSRRGLMQQCHAYSSGRLSFRTLREPEPNKGRAGLANRAREPKAFHPDSLALPEPGHEVPSRLNGDTLNAVPLLLRKHPSHPPRHPRGRASSSATTRAAAQRSMPVRRMSCCSSKSSPYTRRRELRRSANRPLRRPLPA
jgi:hypothetical protein